MLNDYNDVLQKLCHHLKQLAGAEVEITPQTDLINELAIDSVKLLNLIMEIEDEFDISVPINALADVQTVHELANLIHQIKSQKQ
ncbi:acyl carrier protein [Nitrosospira multiformis]|jgi:acyl carrier protein|uniref:Acyl carrier protein n=1 Tax=Nitrosospira multiformis TaxID=1231 RepID=A0A2T5IB05_9PROT|nr:acyl carrier protein [Nitrosospira multiformis]PTQ81009.1 acyl carrier protein [Nitrosospira multiformis]